MLAKSCPDGLESSTDGQGHPVIRTLYDHLEEVTCLEFHPKEPILASGSKDNSIKMFDYAKPSVKKAFRTITVINNEFSDYLINYCMWFRNLLNYGPDKIIFQFLDISFIINFFV